MCESGPSLSESDKGGKITDHPFSNRSVEVFMDGRPGQRSTLCKLCGKPESAHVGGHHDSER